MDYFERLIRRALAVPQQGDGTLFDPFDQVAPLALVSSPSQSDSQADTENTLAVAAKTTTAQVPEKTSPIASVEKVALKPGPTVALFSASPTLQAATVIAALLRAPPSPPIAPSIPAAKRPRANAVASPLTRADAFMEQLGAPPSPPKSAPAIAATDRMPPAQKFSSPELSMASSALSTFVPTVEARLVPVLPVPPTVITPAVQPKSRAVLSDQLAESASREKQAAEKPSSAPERIVQTTVVVSRAAPPRTLDDLAHSSGISRFGLGQW